MNSVVAERDKRNLRGEDHKTLKLARNSGPE